jgi:hypothetical protein
MLQMLGISPTLISTASLIVSAGVLIVYYLEYRQQREQLEQQRRQIQQQETQLERQEQQLEQYQKELSEIEEQTKLARLEHQPHLEVESYEFDGNRIIVTLSNYGNGVAADLEMETHLEVSGVESVSLAPGICQLRRRYEDEQPYESQSIQPDEQRIIFEAEPIVKMVGTRGNTFQTSLPGVLEDLHHEPNCESAGINFRLRYRTLTEQADSVPITDHALSIRLDDMSAPPILESLIDRKLTF